MTITYKKWVSIFGLLAAIIISLWIGLSFDLSVLEGATTMDETPEINPEEENIHQNTPEEETPEEETPEVDLSTPEDDSNNYTPGDSKKRNTDVYNKIMESGPSESFRCITSF